MIINTVRGAFNKLGYFLKINMKYFHVFIQHWKDISLADTVMYRINQKLYFNWSKFDQNDVI